MLLRMKIYGYLWILWSLFILETAKQPLKFHYVYVHFEAILVGPGCRKKLPKKVFQESIEKDAQEHFGSTYLEKSMCLGNGMSSSMRQGVFFCEILREALYQLHSLEFANADRPLRTMILLELCL